VVVVLDVLRATTTIAYALQAGCRDIIPVEDISEAMRLADTLGKDRTLLCGERGGQKIPGFHLGNSPLEYTPQVVEGKTRLLTTTNGTRALVVAQGAEVLTGSFVNLSMVAARAVADERDLLLLCAGRESRFSLEDTVCAGGLLSRLPEGMYELSDAAVVAAALYRRHSDDLLGMMRASQHGRYLVSLGLERDLSVAAAVDALPVVGRLCEGKVVKA
jgi:2-phosphosulfolactate phosphatase